MFDLFETGGNELFDQLRIRSNKELKDTVERVKTETAQQVEADQETQRKRDFFSTLETPDEPGQNILRDFINGKIGGAAPQRVETFDEFLSKRNPAHDFLASIAKGQLARLHGVQGTSHREDLFKQFQVEQRGQIAQQQMRQQNQRAAMQLAGQLQIQKENRLGRAADREADRNLRKEIADQMAEIRRDQVAIMEKLSGPQAAKMRAETENIQKRTEEMAKKVARFEKTPFAAAMKALTQRKGLENIEVDDINELVRGLAVAKSLPKPKGGGAERGPGSVEAGVALQLVKDGNVDLTGSDGIMERFGPDLGQKVWNELGNGKTHVLKNPHPEKGFNVQVANAQEAHSSYNDFFGLVREARLDSEEAIRTGKVSTGLRARIEGFIEDLKGTAGENAAAQLINVIAPARATQFARSGGEVGVLTDRDIVRFLQMLPSVTDTEEELQGKQDLFEKSYVRSLWSIVKKQPRINPPGGRKVTFETTFDQVPLLAADKGMEIEEFLIEAFESGINFTGSEEFD